MARYTVKNKETGQTITFEWGGNAPPTDDEMQEIFGAAEKHSSEPAASKKPEATQTEKYGIAGALFPATTKSAERGGGFISRTIAGAGDVLTSAPRVGSALGTGLGTLAGGGGWKMAASEAAKDLSKTESEEEGLLGFAQDVLYDPTSSPLLLGAGPAAKAAKGATVAAKAAKAAKAIKPFPKLGGALTKTAAASAADAASSAAYQQAKEGEVDPLQTATQGALGAAMGGASSKLGTAVRGAAGKALRGTAIRNLDIALRPGQFGSKIGYDHNNIVKHDLARKTVREIAEAAQGKLDDLYNKAKQIAMESGEVFDVEEIFDASKGKLTAKANPERYTDQIDFLDKLKKDYVEAFGPTVDAADAMKIRTKIGEGAAFVGRETGGVKVDPDATWKEDVYNSVYEDLKNTLHGRLGGELKEINKAQSEIIPIKSVATRRIPTAESNQRFGLSDIGMGAIGAGLGAGGAILSGDESALGTTAKGLALGAAVAGGRRMAGSPGTARMLYKASSRIAPELQDIIEQRALRAKPRAAIQAASTISEAIPENVPNLELPAYLRRGFDPEQQINKEAFEAKDLLVTQDKLKRIRQELAEQGEREASEKAAMQAQRTADIEADIIFENLRTRGLAPVITPEWLQQQRAMQQLGGQQLRAAGRPGEVSYFHRLGKQ